MYLFYEQSRKNDIVWGSQEDKVPVAKTVKKSVYVNISGAMSAKNSMPQGQTVDNKYYVEEILEKEVKLLLKRSKRTNEATRWCHCPYLQLRTGLVSSKPAKLYK